MHKGAAALLWGEPAASMRASAFLLARGVLPAWGEPSRPGLPPEGETEKGEIKFLAAAGLFYLCPRRRFGLDSGMIFASLSDSVPRGQKLNHTRQFESLIGSSPTI